jgi:hypothetical protein
MRFFFFILFYFSLYCSYSQEIFKGINYQALVGLSDNSLFTYEDISSVQVEFDADGSVFYTDEVLVSNFSGKIDVIFADDIDFSTQLNNQLSLGISKITMHVYLIVNTQKLLLESQVLESLLFSNLSLYVIESPLTFNLDDSVINNIETSQLLKYKNYEWFNVNDSITSYSVITSSGNYNFVNQSQYTPVSDSAIYSDTVLYADTVLYDASLFGNKGVISIGTVNDQDVVIKTNSLERIRIKNDGKLSINNSISNATLSIKGDRGLLHVGSFGVGNFPSITSDNIMMWLPKKSAFRIGSFQSNQLLEDTIGLFSFAFGRNAVSNGLSSSIVFGELSSSVILPPYGSLSQDFTDGSGAFSFGYNTQASGRYSFAFGYQSKALFYRGVAIGYKCVTDSLSASLAMGYEAKSYSVTSTSIGYNVITTGEKSTSLGNNASTNRKKGSFVYGDFSSSTSVSNTLNNQFMARASGGVVFYTSSDISSGSILPSGSGSWNNLSYRKSKKNIKKVDPKEYLSLLDEVSIYEWSYISENNAVHIGPVAQNFYRVFKLGNSNNHISMVDADGINFLMLKGLDRRYSYLDTQIKTTTSNNLELEFNDLENRILFIENTLNKHEK